LGCLNERIYTIFYNTYSLKKVGGFDEDKAAKFQDEMAQLVVDAINEKIKREG